MYLSFHERSTELSDLLLHIKCEMIPFLEVKEATIDPLTICEIKWLEL